MESTRTLTKTGGITETGLKWIALVSMLLDHIHYFFGFTGWVPEWFSMVGRLAAPLFLFCLVEGFTHTRSRKKYFSKVYFLSAGMSLLLFFMAFTGILVRPDGFYPANGMMTTFVLLMIVWQGIDWLGQKRILPGLAAVLLPLAWPFAAVGLVAVFPALEPPLGLLGYSFVPMWGITGDSSWPVLAMGAGALPVPQAPERAGGRVLHLLPPLRRGLHALHGVLPGAGLRLVADLHAVLRGLWHLGGAADAVV